MKHIKLFEDFNSDPAIDPNEVIDLISLQDIEALNSLPPDGDLVKRVIEILKKPENKSEREFINQMSCKIGESKMNNTFLSLLLAGASVLGGCGGNSNDKSEFVDSTTLGFYMSGGKYVKSNPELSNLISDFVKNNPKWLSNSFNREEASKKLHDEVFPDLFKRGDLKKVPLVISKVGDPSYGAFFDYIDPDKVVVALYLPVQSLKIPSVNLSVTNPMVDIFALIDKEKAKDLIEGKIYTVDFSILEASPERVGHISKFEIPGDTRNWDNATVDFGIYTGEINSASLVPR